MPPDRQHDTPINHLDAAARDAFREVAERDGARNLAACLGANLRTVERIAGGQRDVPPGMARDLANYLDPMTRPEDEAWHSAFIAWADSREGRA